MDWFFTFADTSRFTTFLFAGICTLVCYARVIAILPIVPSTISLSRRLSIPIIIPTILNYLISFTYSNYVVEPGNKSGNL